MIEILTQSFFINSLIVLAIISLITGVLGSFMLWQGLSYLGDSLSHSALLGIAMALILKISPSISIMVIAISFAILLSFDFYKLYSVDTILNIATNVVLSLSLILMSVIPSANSSIISSLFGDILVLNRQDIILITTTSVFAISVCLYRWKHWVVVSINQELAMAEKINTHLVKLEFSITLAMFIAVSAQLIGILLISAFLLIPSATARIIAKTPIQMVIFATIFSLISGISGLILSAWFDLLTGPVIILTSAIYLVFVYFIRLILVRMIHSNA